MFRKSKVIETSGVVLFPSQPYSKSDMYLYALFREVKKTGMLLIVKTHPRETNTGIYKRIAKAVGLDIVIIRRG